MGKLLASAMLGIGLLAACSEAAPPPPWPPASARAGETDVDSLSYGWTRPVTADAFPDAEGKLGHAHDVIDGHSLSAIVTDARVRVRGDDKACATCHEWAKTADRETFCERAPAFLQLPTWKGDSHDDVSAKPLVLKDLLDRWLTAGCPE